MEALQSRMDFRPGIVWDTEKRMMYFNIKPHSIGDNCRMIITTDGKGNIEMSIQPKNCVEKPRV